MFRTQLISLRMSCCFFPRTDEGRTHGKGESKKTALRTLQHQAERFPGAKRGSLKHRCTCYLQRRNYSCRAQTPPTNESVSSQLGLCTASLQSGRPMHQLSSGSRLESCVISPLSSVSTDEGYTKKKREAGSVFTKSILYHDHPLGINKCKERRGQKVEHPAVFLFPIRRVYPLPKKKGFCSVVFRTGFCNAATCAQLRNGKTVPPGIIAN